MTLRHTTDDPILDASRHQALSEERDATVAANRAWRDMQFTINPFEQPPGQISDPRRYLPVQPQTVTGGQSQTPWYEGIGNLLTGIAKQPVETPVELFRGAYRATDRGLHWATGGEREDLPAGPEGFRQTVGAILSPATWVGMSGPGYEPPTLAQAKTKLETGEYPEGVSTPGALDIAMLPFDVAAVGGIGQAGAKGVVKGILPHVPRTFDSIAMQASKLEAIDAFTDAANLRRLVTQGRQVPGEAEPEGLGFYARRPVDLTSDPQRLERVSAATRHARELKQRFREYYLNQPGGQQMLLEIEAAERRLLDPPTDEITRFIGLDYLTNPRPIYEVIDEVSLAPEWMRGTADPDVGGVTRAERFRTELRARANAAATGIPRAVNPGAFRATEIGKALTARERQIVQSENIILTALASLDAMGSTFRGRPPFDVDVDGFVRDIKPKSGQPYGLWNDVFANPTDERWADKLTPMQVSYIEQFHMLVDETEMLRELNGLPRLGENNLLPEGTYYVPRNIEEIQGLVLNKRTRPELHRLYATAQDGFDDGLIYNNDPVATLQLYMRSAMRDVIDAQFTDHVAPLGVTVAEVIQKANPGLVKELEESRSRLANLRRQLTHEGISRATYKDMTTAYRTVVNDANANFSELKRNLRSAVNHYSAENREDLRGLLNQMDLYTKDVFDAALDVGASNWKTLRTQSAKAWADRIRNVALNARNDAELRAQFQDITRALRDDVDRVVSTDRARQRVAVNNMRETLDKVDRVIARESQTLGLPTQARDTIRKALEPDLSPQPYSMEGIRGSLGMALRYLNSSLDARGTTGAQVRESRDIQRLLEQIDAYSSGRLSESTSITSAIDDLLDKQGLTNFRRTALENIRQALTQAGPARRGHFAAVRRGLESSQELVGRYVDPGDVILSQNIRQHLDVIQNAVESAALLEQRAISSVADFHRYLKDELDQVYADLSAQFREGRAAQGQTRRDVQSAVSQRLGELEGARAATRASGEAQLDQQVRNLRTLRRGNNRLLDFTFFDLIKDVKRAERETRKVRREDVTRFQRSGVREVRALLKDNLDRAPMTAGMARGTIRDVLQGNVYARRDELKAQIAEELATFNKLRRDYRDIKENTAAKEVLGGELFGLAEGPIRVGTWRSRFFPVKDSRALVSAIGMAGRPGSSVPNWLSSAQKFTNLVRLYSSTFDFAAPMIHGFPIMWRHPDKWARLAIQHFQAALAPSTQARYMMDNLDTFREMSLYGVPVGDLEMFTALEPGGTFKVMRVLEDIPGVGEPAAKVMGAVRQEGFGRFQSAFNMFLAGARAELWQANRQAWLNNGESLEDLAGYVRNMTGGLDTRALGVAPNQRAIENMFLAFSPRLLRANMSLLHDALRGAVPLTERSMKQKASARALFQMAGGVMGLYVASGLALGKDWNDIADGLNPRNGRRYLAHQINGDWIGAGGQMRAAMQLAAGLIESGLEGGGDLTRGSFRDNPLLRFYLTRAPIGTRAALGFAEGVANQGKEDWERIDILPFEEIDHLPDFLLHWGESHLPFALQSFSEGQAKENIPSEFFGTRVTPGTPTDRLAFMRREVISEMLADGRLRREDVMIPIPGAQMVGQTMPSGLANAFRNWSAYEGFRPWATLPANIQAEVNRDERVTPLIVKRDVEQAKIGSKFAEWKIKDRALNDDYRATIDALFEEVGYGRDFRKIVSDHTLRWRTAKATLRGEYPVIEEVFGEFDEPDNAFDLALDEYVQRVFNPAFTNQVTGEYDYESRDREVAMFAAKHGPAMLSEIVTYLRSRRPPRLVELANDRDSMRDYWSVVDEELVAAAQRTGDDPNHLRMLYDTYKGGDTQAADALLAQRGLDAQQVNDFKGLVTHIEQRMKDYRASHPAVERLLYKWGYIDTFQNQQAAYELEALRWLDLQNRTATTDRSVFETPDRFKQVAGPMFDSLDMPRPWD